MKGMSSKTIFGTMAVGFAIIGIIPVALAQTASPTMIITWQTSNYVPGSYRGKDLPSPGSNISATLSLMRNGKIVDISGEFISWYLDSHPFKSGRGLTTASFITGEGSWSLRAEIPRFEGTKTFLSKTIAIPVVLPQLVIVAPFPYRTFASDVIKLTTVPYFFNIADPSALSISWTANSIEIKAGAGNPYEVSINVLPGTPPSYPISVVASAGSANNAPGTSGGGAISLIYQ